MPHLHDLIVSLDRWAEIADAAHASHEWDSVSLLHSFGDGLARDIREAVRLLKTFSSSPTTELLDEGGSGDIEVEVEVG